MTERFDGNSVLLVSYTTGTPVTATIRTVTFKGGALAFSEPDVVRAEIEEAIAEQAAKIKSPYVVLSLPDGWKGVTDMQVPVLRGEELDRTLKENPQSLLEHMTMVGAVYSVIYNPTLDQNGLVFTASGDPISQRISALGLRGLTVVRVVGELEALIARSVELKQLDGYHGVIVLTSRSHLQFSCIGGTWINQAGDNEVAAHRKNFTGLGGWVTSTFSGKGLPTVKLAILNGGCPNLEDIKEELGLLPDVSVTVLDEANPKVALESLIFCGRDVTPEYVAVDPPLDSRYRAIPKLAAAVGCTCLLATGAFGFLRFQKVRETVAVQGQVQAATDTISRVIADIGALDKQEGVAKSLREWCRISPEAQMLVSELTKPVSSDCTFQSLDLEMQPTLGNIRVVASIVGEPEGLRIQTRAIYNTMAALNYQLVTVESEMPIPFGTKISAIFSLSSR